MWAGSNKIRVAVAIVTLVVTSARLLAPFATQDAPNPTPVIEQQHLADVFGGPAPRRLPRWPGGNRTPKIRA